ncbi:MAG: hypothetical protein SLRJCFUN_001299 [Candidatus Fervidibacter sp.]
MLSRVGLLWVIAFFAFAAAQPSDWASLEAERDWELDAIASLLVKDEPNAQKFRCVYVLPLREPNAFVSDQGEVIVTEGLLERLEGRDEIAFVLAHELAHLLKGHPRNLERNPSRLERLRTEVERGLGGSVVGTGLNLLLNAVASYYSREREREADEEAIRLMAKAGFDPAIAEGVLKRLGKEEGLLSWFRSHPFLSERLDIVRQAQRRWRPSSLRPSFNPPPMPTEVFVDLQPQPLSGEGQDGWAKLMAETTRWLWSALMDATHQGTTPFRPAKRWQRHRAAILHLQVVPLEWQVMPVAGMTGWQRWQVRMRWQLLTSDGKMVASEEARFGTTFADTEPFSQVLIHAASLLAQRLARFVVQTYRPQKIGDAFSDGSKVGGSLR